MGETNWLQSAICARVESFRQSKLGHPWTMQRADGPWTVASDGHVLAAVRGDHGFPPADANTPNFEEVMRLPTTEPRTLLLPELRALAGAVQDPALPDCATCGNAGALDCDECDGEGSIGCECLDCGHEHEKDCGACKGEGIVVCPDCQRGMQKAREQRPVRIGETPFDLRLFTAPLSNIPGETATFRQAAKDRAAFFEIGEWLLVIMPLRDDPNAFGMSTAPRIEFAEPARAIPSEGERP